MTTLPEAKSNATGSGSLESLTLYLTRIGVDEPRRTAGALLREFGSVSGLLGGSSSRLAEIVGEDAASIIRASQQLVLDALGEELAHGPILSGGKEVVRYLQSQFAGLRTECLWAFYTDRNLRLIHRTLLASGSASSVAFDIPRLIHIALDIGAQAFLLAHNHPSGDPTPSRSDILLTARLNRIATELGLRLVDHLIIAGGKYRSVLHLD